MSTETKINVSNKRGEGALAKSGVFAGLLSFIGASCCVLPILLVNLGVSTSLVAKLGFFAWYQAWFQWATIALLIGAAVLAFSHGRPRTRTLVWLGIGAIFVFAAHIIPFYEGELLRWIRR